MASDVDVMVLAADPICCAPATQWFQRLRPGSRLVRTAIRGAVLEQPYRLRSGLPVETDVAPLSWANLPLDLGTRRVLRVGHQLLHDPSGALARAAASLRDIA